MKTKQTDIRVKKQVGIAFYPETIETIAKLAKEKKMNRNNFIEFLIEKARLESTGFTLKFLIIIFLLASCSPKLPFRKVVVLKSFDYEGQRILDTKTIKDTIIQKTDPIELKDPKKYIQIKTLFLQFISQDSTCCLVNDTLWVRLQRNGDIKIMKRKH